MKDFSKDDTKVIKGVAILLMIALHCFAFPDRIGNYNKIISLPIYIQEETLLMCISKFGILCLSIYTFLAGYGMYKQSNQNKKYSVSKRIFSLFTEYWKVFIIFLPIGFIFYRNQEAFCNTPEIYNIFNEIRVEKLVKDFLGLTSSYNREWWFVLTYFFAIILGNVYLKALKKCQSFWIEFLLIAVLSIFYSVVVPNVGKIPLGEGINGNWFYRNLFYVHYSVPALFMGIACGKYSVLVNINKLIFEKYNNVIKMILAVFVISLIIYIKNYYSFIGVDLIIVPIFIVCIMNIVNVLTISRKILSKLGEYSTTMWLVHSFYCYYFGNIQKLLYGLRVDMFIFIAVVLLSFITAVLIKYFYMLLNKYIFNKIFIKKEVQDDAIAE